MIYCLLPALDLFSPFLSHFLIGFVWGFFVVFFVLFGFFCVVFLLLFGLVFVLFSLMIISRSIHFCFLFNFFKLFSFKSALSLTHTAFSEAS